MPDLRCRSGKHCVARTSDGAAVIDRDGICARCVDDLQKRFDQLSGLIGMLKLFLGGSMRSAIESKVSRTPEPQAPLNVHVDAMIGDIEDVIDRVNTLQVQDLVKQPAQLFILWIKDVQQKRYLDGCQRALDIRRVHSRAVKALGLEPVWTRRLAPCPSCGLPCLGSWTGSDRIECTNCDFTTTIEEYEKDFT